MTRTLAALSAAVAALVATTAAAEEPSAEVLYATHCAVCHGDGRLGGTGPALLPENLGRLKKTEAADVIAHGRAATQMVGYGEVLDEAEIATLVDYIFTPLPAVPDWTLADMRETHTLHVDPATLPPAPQHDADPLNLFIVVETGDHHATILDGDRFEPLDRFETRYALHGGAKYSPDGRFVYLASRDGWVQMYDLHSLQMVGEVRAGINTRNVAVSGDGRWLMVGNMLPHSVVVLDARDLSPVKAITVADSDGKESRVSAVYTAPPRDSFVVALKDIKEIWEIPYAGAAPDFAVRPIAVPDFMDDFFFDQDYRVVVGAARNDKQGAVVDLDRAEKVADIDLSGMPHLGSGITWQWQGRDLMATPHLRDAAVSVIDMNTWETVKRIETLGPGFFMRSHDNTPYAWTDVFFGPNRDVMHILDKRTLELVKTMRPEPGKTVAHVEFTRDGSHALVSVMEADGALIVYDAETFEEVRRIPMKRPSGKYNVFNKITYARGTSH